MRALEWFDILKLRIKEVQEPETDKGWVILKVGYAGICGSELSAFKGENELRKPPSIMGHEFSGTVISAGSTENMDLIGKKVAVNPLLSCGKCSYCVSGERQLCHERKLIGVNYQGAFAEYVSVPASSCHVINDLISGALAEPLATSVRTCRKSKVKDGDSVLLIGAGTIGLMSIAVLKEMSTSYVAVSEPNENRRKWALAVGADNVINPLDSNVGFEKFDSVIDAVGLETTRNLAVTAVKRGKVVVFVGLHTPRTNLMGSTIVRNEVQVHGSFAYSDKDFAEAINLLENGLSIRNGGWFDIRELETGSDSFKELLDPSSKYAKILMKP